MTVNDPPETASATAPPGRIGKTPKTDYIVLMAGEGNGPAGETDFTGLWAVKDTINASSADNAIKQHADKQGDKVAGKTLVAVPARSWRPRTIKVETVSKVTLG